MNPADVAILIAGLKALSGVNWAGALASIETQNAAGELQSAEQVALVISGFTPYAIEVELGITVLNLIIWARQRGYWRPGEPTDPAEDHAAGDRPGGR